METLTGHHHLVRIHPRTGWRPRGRGLTWFGDIVDLSQAKNQPRFMPMSSRSVGPGAGLTQSVCTGVMFLGNAHGLLRLTGLVP